MRNEHALQQFWPVDNRVRAVAEITAVTALVTLGAWVKIPLPWTPVPVTLQTLPVLVAAYLVGPHRAALGIALYIGLGMAGAPVFTQFGATFGFILAFLAAPYLVTAFRSPAWGMAAAMLCIYVVGAAWLSVFLSISPMAALWAGVIPFIPCDVVKGGLAYTIAKASMPDSQEPHEEQ